MGEKKEPMLKPIHNLIIGLVMTTVTFVLALVAYLKWNNSIDEFFSVLNNWEKGPIFNMNVKTSGSPCDAGYSGIEEFDKYSFQVPVCKCRNGGPFKYQTCSTAQIQSGCNNTKETETMEFDAWRGDMKLCVQRDVAQNAYKRLRTQGNCPSGFRKCFLDDDSCFPNALNCPVTAWAMVGPGQPSPFNYSLTLGSSGWTLSYERGTFRPVTDLAIRLGTFKVSGYQQVDALNEMQMLQENNQWTAFQGKMAQTGGNTWRLGQRPEIFWDPLCPRSRDDVKAISSKVKLIDKSIAAQFFISLFVSLFNIAAVCYIYQQQTDDDDSNDNEWVLRKNICNALSEFVIFIPTVAACSIAWQSRAFFLSVKDAGCSDLTINTAFSLIGTKISDIGGPLLTTKMTLTFLYLLYRIYKLVKGSAK